MNDYAASEFRAIVQNDMWIYDRIRTDNDVIADICKRIDDDVVADGAVLADDDVSMDRNVLTDMRGVGDLDTRMYALINFWLSGAQISVAFAQTQNADF